MQITSVIEKFGRGGYNIDNIYLTEIDSKIAHTITTHQGGIDMQHCNLILEITENDSNSKYAETRNGNNY